LLSFAGTAALLLAAAASAAAQNTQPAQTTTVTTQTTQAVQNPDGTWTVIQYPADKEVVVDLTPSNTFSNATGRAKVTRSRDNTMISLDLSGLPAAASGMNLYAVDPLGKVTPLGPVTFNNGVSQQTYTTPLDRFMLVLSPEASLSTYGPNTTYAFRSAVPQGFAVVPLNRPEGERVAATSTAGATTAYAAPMLGIPRFARGSDTEVKVNLTGALTGSRVNFNIEPRKDGPTTVVARFHELKEAPAGHVYVLWAVSPDNKYVKLGQVVNTGARNEAEIKSETTLTDFGLLITLEEEHSMPMGTVVGTVTP
jgi:hypothetical protein